MTGTGIPLPGSAGALEEALGAVIAERVREFRLQLGLTVGQLAELTGLSKGMLSKIENAQASPSLATLARLSGALKVPVTAFFRGLNEEQDVLHVKAGRGLDIQHKGSGPGHRYQLLGTMRAPHNSLETLLVTLTERAESSRCTSTRDRVDLHDLRPDRVPLRELRTCSSLATRCSSSARSRTDPTTMLLFTDVVEAFAEIEMAVQRLLPSFEDSKDLIAKTDALRKATSWTAG